MIEYQNKFEANYSSQNKRINIKLENFKTFFHRPFTEGDDDDVDPKYINRENPIHQLTNWLKHNATANGAYLVTGYRGAGKSSLVGKVLYELKQLGKKQKNETKLSSSDSDYLILHINLGQENIEEKEILRTIAKMLETEYVKYITKSIIYRLVYKLFKCLQFLRDIWFFIVSSIIFYGLAYYLKTNNFPFLNNIDLMAHCTYICIGIGVIIVMIVCYLIFKNFKFIQVLLAIRTLTERLSASISIENSANTKFDSNIIRNLTKRTKTYGIASIQEIEFELIEILKLVRRTKCKPKIVIVLDELDKAESNADRRSENEIPEYEKLSIRPEQKITSRTRKQHVLSIIANMKFFLSTAKAYFIFIAGRELYEAFQADMSDRDFSISSIFSGVINVDSFLSSSRYQNNSSLLTEQFICKQILPSSFSPKTMAGNYKYPYDEKNIYSLKNYYSYRMNTGLELDKDVWRDVCFLYHFASYLSYISNGSPKKMALFFEKNIREYSYLKDNHKIENDNNKDISQPQFYLSFGYYTQQKINFIHYLTYPIMQSIINRSNMYGDKLLVSSSFLISHILKFHNNGFSWRNLEQTPELLEINKTPEIREYISSIIDYMNHTHLTTVPCGLYHYKFPMRITEEISYYSKVSGEISALFNFSLDELQSIKSHYARLLNFHGKQDTERNRYAKASIHHSLGDIYMMEENYSQAIREYETCIELSTDLTNTDKSHSDNYLLFLTRTMLKLGLVHEKRRTDNSAFLLYNDLISRLINALEYDRSKILFQDMRIMFLAILAKLYVLEKIDTDGIKPRHIAQALHDFHLMADAETSLVTKADFYRKLGDILYYKNTKWDSKTIKKALDAIIVEHNKKSSLKIDIISNYPDIVSNANECYRKSIGLLLNIEYEDENLCNIIFNRASYKKDKDEIRDNYIYCMALACEALGHESFASEILDIKETKPEIFVNLVRYIKGGDNERLTFKPANNLEKAIMYYWTASRLYNTSCERGLAGRCFKEIIHVINAYISILNIEQLKDNYNDLSEFIRLVINHYLIAKYRQYEHIHLSEINSIKWMRGMELFEYIQLSNLSISPDIEEIIYSYYSIKLKIACTLERYETPDAALDHVIEKERHGLMSFYKSDIMTGKMTCNTLTSSILNLRLKARLGKFLLSRLMNTTSDNINLLRIADISSLIDRRVENPWLLEAFPEIKENSIENKLDILQFLITDGLFCLSRILELIIPLRNTTLFNNSFKGDIYYHMISFNHLYKLLYCYYCYGNSKEDDKKIVSYLNENNAVNQIYIKDDTTNQERKNSSNIAGHSSIVTSENLLKETALNVFPEDQDDMQIIASMRREYTENNTSVTIQRIKSYSNSEERKKAFLNAVFQATRKSNPSNTLRIYLAENAIHYYTRARQVHTQGKTYQEMIRNLHFLDDDLNNNTCQFYLAEERYYIHGKKIGKREINLKRYYSQLYPYNIDNYFQR